MSIDLDTAHVTTRLLVAGCFVIAACVTAHRRRVGYTIFYVLAAIETYAKYRYEFVGVARGWLVGSHPSNADKYAIQIKVLIVATLAGAALALAIIVRLRRKPAELALVLGTAGVLAVFAVETISYHYVDAVIYVVDAGVMRSGWLYVAATVVAIGGASCLPRRR